MILFHTTANLVTIPVIEERVVVGKEVVETGTVRITKRVSTHDETIDVPLTHQEVRVERVAVNQYVDAPPEVRHEGDVMIIPVLREVMVKRFLIVEELHVRKHYVKTQATQSVTLRKEEVLVERQSKVQPYDNPEL
ncbi:MAG: YsnF/AvaK domain-containing protein [Cytophagaceae bacterium]|nr:YsnF/AvaK domain-containing protein [Cytophagaceae bacterium]